MAQWAGGGCCFPSRLMRDQFRKVAGGFSGLVLPPTVACHQERQPPVFLLITWGARLSEALLWGIQVGYSFLLKGARRAQL